MGTPGFMAPEVANGVTAGVPADIYGFAASLYFAITGSTPKDTNHAPASALIAGVPEELDDALVQALDEEPTRRHGSATELASQLAAIVLPWTGSFPIDRMTSSLPPTTDDPTVDPEAPPTQREARRARTV